MTLEELRLEWREYGIRQHDGVVVRLADIAASCMGPCKGGLLFDSGGAQGSSAWIFKCDDQGVCYVKSDWTASDDASWVRIGLFVRVPEVRP